MTANSECSSIITTARIFWFLTWLHFAASIRWSDTSPNGIHTIFVMAHHNRDIICLLYAYANALIAHLAMFNLLLRNLKSRSQQVRAIYILSRFPCFKIFVADMTKREKPRRIAVTVVCQTCWCGLLRIITSASIYLDIIQTIHRKGFHHVEIHTTTTATTNNDYSPKTLG